MKRTMVITILAVVAMFVPAAVSAHEWENGEFIGVFEVIRKSSLTGDIFWGRYEVVSETIPTKAEDFGTPKTYIITHTEEKKYSEIIIYTVNTDHEAGADDIHRNSGYSIAFDRFASATRVED